MAYAIEIWIECVSRLLNRFAVIHLNFIHHSRALVKLNLFKLCCWHTMRWLFSGFSIMLWFVIHWLMFSTSELTMSIPRSKSFRVCVCVVINRLIIRIKMEFAVEYMQLTTQFITNAKKKKCLTKIIPLAKLIPILWNVFAPFFGNFPKIAFNLVMVDLVHSINFTVLTYSVSFSNVW